jgi:hypothetical protein
MDEQMIPFTPDPSQVKLDTSTRTVPTGAAQHHIKASMMPQVIAYMLTMGLLSFAALLCFREIPASNQRLVDTLFGGLLVGCTTAWGYCYTSNQASEARSALRISKGTP